MPRTPDLTYDAVLLDGIFRLTDWLPYQCSFVANRVSTLLARMYHDEFGISAPGWRIVAVLGSHPPMSAKGLAVLTGMDQVNITRAVGALVDQRLVLRKTDAEDRRRVVLRLSAKGVEVFSRVVPVAREAEKVLTEDLTVRELSALRRAMAKVVAAAATTLSDTIDREEASRTDVRAVPRALT
jgi:DNA-binding MarR family transcriptional regulator